MTYDVFGGTLSLTQSVSQSVLVGHQTFDSQGSTPALAPLCLGLGQATYTCVPLSPSSRTWYGSKGGDALRLGR